MGGGRAYAVGPQPPLAGALDAAPQLHQTGHSRIAQHFPSASDGSADKATFSSMSASMISFQQLRNYARQIH